MNSTASSADNSSITSFCSVPITTPCSFFLLTVTCRLTVNFPSPKSLVNADTYSCVSFLLSIDFCIKLLFSVAVRIVLDVPDIIRLVAKDNTLVGLCSSAKKKSK